MFVPARKIYNWAAQKAYSPQAPLWLGVVFLLEIVLILPLDALLMLFCMENRKKRHLYAAVATLASTLSGVMGYLLGYLLWDLLSPIVLGHLISIPFFERLVSHYQEHEYLAVAIGALLPVPFKAITLSAGVCHLALLTFILSVVVARFVRFFAIAEMMYWWGEKIKGFVDRHFNRIVMAIGAKIALAVTFLWALSR